MPNDVQDLISFLKTNKFKAECPSCGGKMDLDKTPLFDADNFTPEAKELLKEIKENIKLRMLELKERTNRTTQRVETTTQSVNIGFILERLAPALNGFRFDKNDCRSLFDPIDYVIFEGLNKTGSVQKIIFTDIKTGEARLKKNQRVIKKMVQDKQVEFRKY
jgi:hypothetical protein